MAGLQQNCFQPRVSFLDVLNRCGDDIVQQAWRVSQIENHQCGGIDIDHQTGTALQESIEQPEGRSVGRLNEGAAGAEGFVEGGKARRNWHRFQKPERLIARQASPALKRALRMVAGKDSEALFLHLDIKKC
jgi:hypothetical protein